MSYYTIKLDYSYFDGNHLRRVQSDVYLVWEDIEQAKEALARIKDHFHAVQSNESVEEVCNKPWYSGPLVGGDDPTWHYWVVATQNDGKSHALNAFWLAKGTKLHTAEVCLYQKEVTTENGMKFFF